MRVRSNSKAAWHRWTSFAVLAVLFVTFVGASAAAPSANEYSAAITPTTVEAGVPSDFTFTATNSTTSWKDLGSVNIYVPSGFTVNSLGAVTAAGAKSWAATLNAGVVELRAVNDIIHSLDPGQSVSVEMNVTACSRTGSGTWASEAKESSTFAGSEFFTLVGSHPVVTTDECAVVCTSESATCEAVAEDGTTISAAPPPEDAALVLNFDEDTTSFVCGRKSLTVIGSQVIFDPKGYDPSTTIDLTFEFVSSAMINKTTFCLDKGSGFFAVSACSKGKPSPPCYLGRTSSAGRIVYVVRVPAEDPVGSLG